MKDIVSENVLIDQLSHPKKCNNYNSQILLSLVENPSLGIKILRWLKRSIYWIGIQPWENNTPEGSIRRPMDI